jgi:hypothetical protein
VAETAGVALTEDRLLYGTFELCAEGDLNREEVAALMSDVLGRKIRAARLNLEKTGDTSKESGDGEQSPLIKAMFDWYNAHSLLGNALTLRAILGREPRTLRAYIEDLAESYSSG